MKLYSTMRFEQWSDPQQTGIYPIELTGQLHAFFSLYVILLDLILLIKFLLISVCYNLSDLLCLPRLALPFAGRAVCRFSFFYNVEV